ncbi:glutamyl-tRNA(Gln) amidotransferase, subunit D [Caldisphaera lagunensis DSM 15908]|uniref:Glutamyl-tRNA(Gln) amidotransferase subunit D n=1 Tax=Caldisphaera lagunensis (strain DSM 15908 / JCM 11604 / ANMR 0165 / IC-154) TaxID=1056495 RepID=L0A8E9_CALLD|nr:glutamyl-tRNA(Gln) amidotransferase, subunit D [Caldisphaera lagunensis DSM 15908]
MLELKINEFYFGYYGMIADKLKEINAAPGDYISIKNGNKQFNGTLMPKNEFSKEDIIVLKLDNGYNIGVKINEKSEIQLLKKGQLTTHAGEPVKLVEKEITPPENKRILVLGTGGTIASRVDYETGAVKPYLDPNELVAAVPEVLNYTNIEAEEILSIFSEDMNPKYWDLITYNIFKKFNDYDGLIIAHGTDTMAYTASAVAFVFNKGLKGPIVFTGSQRSSDRPSSDSAFNIISSAIVASKAPFGEVCVVMHGETSDSYALAHRATKVRKMHTSRRDAFQSINDIPLAKIYPFEGKLEIINKSYKEKKDINPEFGFDDRVALIKYYPGMSNDIIDFLVDNKYHGIVIEGTGFGHISNRLIDSLERAYESEIPVVITSQTLFGRVNLNVYSTGRKMLQAGVIPGEDMLPETAYVKLSWVLSRTRNMNEIKNYMLTNLAGEINLRHELRLYPRWYHG